MQDNFSQKKKAICLQLPRMVLGANDGSNRGNSNFTYYSKHPTAKYSRMFLFCKVESKAGLVVCMIKWFRLNEKLWVQNPQLRDNRVITIGTFIAILNPLPIQNQLGHKIIILECHTSGIVLCPPRSYYPIQIDNSLPQNKTRMFVLNNVHLSCVSMTVESTQCSGLFWNWQQVLDIIRPNKDTII